jgi:hypothetical protein
VGVPSVLASALLLASPGWRPVLSADGVTVEARPREGSRFAELRATVTVALPAEALCAGAFGTSRLDQREPNLKSRQLLSESVDERVTFDHISAPVVSDRDYVVRTRRAHADDGTCRVTTETVNGLAPPPRAGVVRVEQLDCRWDFVPLADGRTHVTYVVWTDPNTPLPAFLVEPSRQRLAVQWVNLVLERARQGVP